MQPSDRLIQTLRGYESCAVAFSAGVDSSVVAKAACLALGERAVAVTGVGPAFAEGELEQARQIAAAIGVRHEIVSTDEINKPGYLANQPDRCFHCKTELYTHVQRVARRLGIAVIANGANTDDQGDYRPGMQAAADYQVCSPLVEADLDKHAVRALAKEWGLPVWAKPAAPCLASRVAYGLEVTPQRLRMIDLAEQAVRALGIREARVRCLPGDRASIEVPVADLPRLSAPSVQEPLFARLRSLGFSKVACDPEGYRSGSLNDVLSVETLDKWKR